MKDKKDISDLIRDNQHKLDEQPSERTWKRLESKLDNRRSKGHTFLYRQIAMAAAVVALVAVISLITILSDKQSSKFAKAEDATPIENWILQDLETVYTDATTNVRVVVDFQKQLKARYANPIQEGNQAKKLLASNKTFTGSVNRPERLAKEMLAMKENNKVDDFKSTELEEDEIKSSAEIASKEVISKPNTSLSRARKMEAPEEDYLTSTQKMEWIVGEWMEGNSIHEIQKANKSTILCDEFLIKEKRNGVLFLIISKTQESFGLITDEENKKVFSNKNSDRIILEKINSNKFTWTFLPTKGVKERRVFTK